jgi:hypothetical protein
MNEGFPKIEIENESEKTSITEDIKAIFVENPELAAIGTPEQYSKYIDGIFPSSTIKDILWHTTDADFESFSDEYIKAGTHGAGFYFTHREKLASTSKRNIAAIVNARSPILLQDRWKDDEAEYKEKLVLMGEKIHALVTAEGQAELDRLNEKIDNDFYIQIAKAFLDVDSASYKEATTYINMGSVESYSEFIDRMFEVTGFDSLVNMYDNYPEYVVKSSNQTHILGSKKDMEKFKEFVG